jgi:hypothetical protein
MEEKIKVLMDSLKISREEALKVIEDDKRIDKGEKLFELSPELAAGAKKARMTGTRTTKGATTKKPKAVDNDKLHLMNLIEIAIGHNDNTTDFNFINPERECTFNYKGKKYKLVLSCPRT